jgi:hypothetical protein
MSVAASQGRLRKKARIPSAERPQIKISTLARLNSKYSGYEVTTAMAAKSPA